MTGVYFPSQINHRRRLFQVQLTKIYAKVQSGILIQCITIGKDPVRTEWRIIRVTGEKPTRYENIVKAGGLVTCWWPCFFYPHRLCRFLRVQRNPLALPAMYVRSHPPARLLRAQA